MDILGVQIVAILFGIFMLYVAFLHWRRRELKSLDFLFWGTLWFSFIAVTLFPYFLQSLTQLLFFARVMDLLMVIAFMILAFMGFQNYVSNKKMEKKIESLVRKGALRNVKGKKQTS